ncbi:MAG: hypothetical protein ACE15C_18510 [Phycisphaerae bacterium]
MAKAPAFPRTRIENLSVSRMIIGTNWMLGYSHQTVARNDLIKRMHTAKSMADILEVFLKAGVDTMMGPFFLRNGGNQVQMVDAVKDAQYRTGKKITIIATPGFFLEGTAKADADNEQTLDDMAKIGADICMPHQSATDALLDIRGRRFDPYMTKICKGIRARGMIPGLSTHAPESIIYADESGLDVATYISLYNAIGFLMHVEIDWIQKVIWGAKNPVLTIKPMAAGRLPPLVGLAFAWSTIRPKDMVTVGCTTPDEARECIDISLGILNGTGPQVELQRTRSKASIEKKK